MPAQPPFLTPIRRPCVPSRDMSLAIWVAARSVIVTACLPGMLNMDVSFACNVGTAPRRLKDGVTDHMKPSSSRASSDIMSMPHGGSHVSST